MKTIPFFIIIKTDTTVCYNNWLHMLAQTEVRRSSGHFRKHYPLAASQISSQREMDATRFQCFHYFSPYHEHIDLSLLYFEISSWVLELDTSKALDKITKQMDGKFDGCNTSQSLGRMSIMHPGQPLMCITFNPQLCMHPYMVLR